MTRTSTELPRLEPESSASTNSAMAAKWIKYRWALIWDATKNGLNLGIGGRIVGMKSSLEIYNKSRPFLASIKERYSLSKPGSNKHTHHIVLDLSNSGMTYEVGDSLAIYPLHDPELVSRTIKAMGAKGDEFIKEKHSGSSCLLPEFLAKKSNITEVSRKLIQELAKRQTNSPKKERLEFLLAEGNKDALKEYQKNHEVWDALEENREARFGLEELCHMLQPMLPRFYSIASSMKVVGEEVHLTVSYIKYEANSYMRLGVCSHYLCDMAPLDQPLVPVYVQPNHGFTLPDNPEADLIMIGPGTGIAPYRAFLQERMALNASGNNWLFFGEWNRDYDFFYEDYWLELIALGKLRLDTAFSRDQHHKIYVQHRMQDKAFEIWSWIEKGAYIFVCGDAHRMAKDVDITLLNIVQDEGKMDEQAAKDYIKKLRTEKRFLKDVY